MTIPTFDLMMNPLIDALKQLGGSASIEELNKKIFEIMDLSDDILSIPHSDDSGSISEVEYRLAWTRTYLKKFGLIENSSRGVWSLTEEGRNIENIDSHKIVNAVRKMKGGEKKDKSANEEVDDEFEWQEKVMKALLTMNPSAFERLIQRLLRESGFTQVEVTGRSGDNGIDGKGIIRLGGLLSFHVLFQCKRYSNSVGPNIVRDFRGALVGRADKGLLITTGTFTREAIIEAIRDGATPIDLIDGDRLIELLKQFSLGINTKKVEVEQVEVNSSWFNTI